MATIMFSNFNITNAQCTCRCLIAFDTTKYGNELDYGT